jgi:NADH:ubiquinone oxidoreductase subunit C
MTLALSSLIAGRHSASVIIGRRLQQCGNDDVEVITVAARDLLAVAHFLRTDPDADCDLVDLTAIDRHGRGGPRFVLIAVLCSRSHQTRARLEVALDDEQPSWPTLSAVWPVATLYERELIDLMGLSAEGHTNPRRLLLPETFVGHPLRLDYPIEKFQSPVPEPEHGDIVVVEKH